MNRHDGTDRLSLDTAGRPLGAAGAWVPVSSLSDEFDGPALDATKWHDHDPGWKGRPTALFDPSCVRIEAGELQLLARPADNQQTLPPGFTHLSGFVKAKHERRYGFFEIRAKVLDADLVSVFWLYQHTPEEWTEIDIIECPAGVPEFRRVLPTNVHRFHAPGYRPEPGKNLYDSFGWTAPFDLAADYHVYGLEWSERLIRWYVDGRMIRERANEYWHQPLHICLNIEANPHFKALATNGPFPGIYHIDYIRTWEPAPLPERRKPVLERSLS